MELYQLRYFAYAAKYENITMAAQELNVSQPSISKAIQSLERELKTELLRKNGRSCVLTHDGYLLQERVVPLLEEIERLPLEFHNRQKKKLIRLNVVLDEKDWIESVPLPADMERVEKEIIEAKKQADIVLVSFHGHETDGEDTTVPSMFLETFSRRCVDAGADAVIGHGPHELRGIEIYHGAPIFYSLGNFLFETETVEKQPYDAYINKKMPQKGVPVLIGDENVLAYLAELSKPYGTEMEIKDGVGTIRL